VAAAQQAPHDIAAHPAEADHSQLHAVLPLRSAEPLPDRRS
jgi:hypothetical protein